MNDEKNENVSNNLVNNEGIQQNMVKTLDSDLVNLFPNIATTNNNPVSSNNFDGLNNQNTVTNNANNQVLHEINNNSIHINNNLYNNYSVNNNETNDNIQNYAETTNLNSVVQNNLGNNINNAVVDNNNTNKINNDAQLNNNGLVNVVKSSIINSNNDHNINNSYNSNISNVQQSVNNNTVNNLSNNKVNFHSRDNFASLNTSEKADKKDIIKLILSILNALLIVPFVYKFSILYFLFSGISGTSPSYVIIIFGSVYVIGSIIFLLKSIWRIIRHKKVLKIIFVGIILFLIMSNTVSYFNTRNTLNKQRENLNSTPQMTEAKFISNPAYSSDGIEFAVKKIYYHDDYVYIKLYLNNKTSNKYYNAKINKIKINYIQVVFENDVFSNFSKVSSWVGPLSSSDSYGILIRNNELEKKGIKKDKINSISYNFSIYSSNTNSENYDDFVSFDNYYDVILDR